MYQKPDKPCFQEPQKLESLINTGRLVQKFLPKQADIDKILKIIQMMLEVLNTYSFNSFNLYNLRV